MAFEVPTNNGAIAKQQTIELVATLKPKRTSSRRNYNNYTTFIDKILHERGCGSTDEVRRAFDTIIKQLIRDLRHSIEELSQKAHEDTGREPKRVVIHDVVAAISFCFPLEMETDLTKTAKRATSTFCKTEGNFRTKVRSTGITLPTKRIRKSLKKSCTKEALIYIVSSIDYFVKYAISEAIEQMLSKMKQRAKEEEDVTSEKNAAVRHRITMKHLDRAIQRDESLRHFFGMYTIPHLDPELNIHVYKAAANLNINNKK